MDIGIPQNDNAPGKDGAFRLFPYDNNNCCLEIYLEEISPGGWPGAKEAGDLLRDLESEFARELFAPLSHRLREALAEILPALKKEGAALHIRNIKIYAKGSLLLIIPVYLLINSAPLRAAEDKLSMTYLYLGNKAQQINYISQSQKSLDIVAPGYFTLDDNGNLQASGVSQDFIAFAHGQGLKVVPYLSNGWDRAKGQKALENREKLAADLAKVISDNQLDGVNVDLENLTENERDQYTAFIKLLRQELPANKEVSVAVAANPNNWTKGWQASYDYTGLAKYSDYLMVMAYDEHYGGSAAGPVASFSFVEKSLKYALSQIGPAKIVLGLPFYGRIWSTDSANISGRGLALTSIHTIINNYNAVVGYSGEYQSAYARFSVKKSDPVISYNGTALKEGSYIIWYENSDSLKKKLSLVQQYDIKGTGSWSLGEETADVWDYYSLWLEGKYFADIDNSFAKDAIIKAASSGLMTGVSENSFAPAAALTRAQAAAIFCRLLHLSGAEKKAPFADIAGHWAEYEINAAYQAGLVFGYADGGFHPNAELTREEAAALLARVIDLSPLSEDDYPPFFSDIEKGRWSYREISALASAQILRGYEDGAFAPAKILNREETAALLDRIEIYLSDR